MDVALCHAHHPSLQGGVKASAVVVADDELGRAAADVDHDCRLGRDLAVAHRAEECELRLFVA